MTLSLQLLWNYWSDFHETWYVDRTSYGVMHIGRKFCSPHFCGSYAPWNLENILKSTNNLSFLCQFFINEITASDAGPDIIRSHLFKPIGVAVKFSEYVFRQAENQRAILIIFFQMLWHNRILQLQYVCAQHLSSIYTLHIKRKKCTCLHRNTETKISF